MRVVLAQRLPWLPGLFGASRFNVHLLEALAPKHECRMLALASQEEGEESIAELRREAQARGITEAPSPTDAVVHVRRDVQFQSVPNGVRLWNLLAAQIREFDPDVILVSEDRTLIGLATAMEEGGAERVIYLAQSQSTLPFGPESFESDQVRTALLRRAAGLLVPSNYMRDYVRRWSGIEAHVLSIPAYGSPPFPDLGNFANGFVTFVNASAIKGMSIFEEMARARSRVSFAAVPTWATTTADRERLLRLPNVRLLAPAEDFVDVLKQTRVLLVPSLWGEAFGRVVVEAMLRGIPVLASDCGGLVEAKLGVDYLLPVRPIEGYLKQTDERHLPVPVVPTQDVGPWLEALDRLLGSPEHYRQISAASREAALKYVSSLDIGDIETILANLATRPRPAARTKRVDSLPDLSQERLEALAMLVNRQRSTDEN